MADLEKEFLHIKAPADRHEGETGAFIARLRHLLNQLGYDKKPMNFLLSYVFNKLSPATREQILLHRASDLPEGTPSHGIEDLDVFCKLVQESANTVTSLPGRSLSSREVKNSSSSSSSSASKPPGNCHMHGGGKHDWKDCSLNAASPNYMKGPAVSPGSKKRKGPPTSTPSNSSVVQKGGTGKPVPNKVHNPDIVCHTCQQKGHIARNCPSSASRQGSGKQ
jgi:hypothetical protein